MRLEKLLRPASIVNLSPVPVIIGTLILAFLAYVIVRSGLKDARWQHEQEKRVREAALADTVVEWLLALRAELGIRVGTASMRGVVGVISGEPILCVITSERLARCGVDGLSISRFCRHYADAVLHSTDTTLTLKVTEELLLKWATDGLTLDCIATLLLDAAARLSLENDATRIAVIRTDQGKCVQKAHEKLGKALQMKEVMSRDDARRACDGMPGYRIAKAMERAGRPYAEALKFSDEVLERVLLRLQGEEHTALIAALWKAAVMVHTSTR